MMPFAWSEPASLDDAVRMLDQGDQTMRPIAGGTALMLMMKTGVFTPSHLVSLAKIERRYFEIAADHAGGLRIGAMASLAALERADSVARYFPMMTGALKTLSNIRVRNVACVGGALAHGDPHMDLPPLLAALNARAVIVSPGGTRELAIEDLYAGYYETHLERNELISEVLVPPLGGSRAAFVKVTSRSADDWPALSLAVLLRMDGPRIGAARIVLSAATEKVTRLVAAENAVVDSTLDDAICAKAGDAAVNEVSLLSDAHGSAAYKRELLRVYLGRALRQALS